MRFGQRHRNTCCKVVASGHSTKWVESAKYKWRIFSKFNQIQMLIF